MGHRAVIKVKRLSTNSDDVIATVKLAGPPADAGSPVTVDAGSSVTVFVSQGGALAIGCATVPSNHTAETLDVTATLQDPEDRGRFTEEDPLTVTSHVAAIWNSALLQDPDTSSNDATAVWSATGGHGEPGPTDGN